jgi:acetolactate synthase-1/3 small subunit
VTPPDGDGSDRDGAARQRTYILRLVDEPGALERVVGALRRRSLNIESLNVAPTETPGRSRLTLVAAAAGAPRLAHHLRKAVPVLDAEDVTHEPIVARELALLRVRAAGEREARRLAELVVGLGGRVVAAGGTSAIVEIAGHAGAVERLVAAVQPFGLLEMARSGPVAMVHEARASVVGPDDDIHDGP